MKKIGFFGGSFNPPTYAHMEIAKKSIKQKDLDEFFFVPVGNSYSKPDLIDEKHRYNMLKIACENEKNIKVEDIELGISNRLSAIDVFKMIEKKYKKVEIYYIMGADNFEKITTWKDAEILIEKRYIIFDRNNSKIQKNIKEDKELKDKINNFSFVEFNSNISSGIIRNLIKKNGYDECAKYTKPEIIEYIRNNKLYK